MLSLISVKFEALFGSSPCMVCKTLLIPKDFCISKSVVCDASLVLTWISSAKNESSLSGILSISVPVGNSRLGFVRALKDLSNAGASFINEFCSRKLPVYLVRETHFSPN